MTSKKKVIELMEAQVADVTGTEFNKKFNIFNVDCSLVNALRHTILSQVPSIAFKNNSNDIVFKENTTKYHNEFLMHRISLIPLNITNDNFEVDNYKFVINMKNNKNENDFYVTSEHFEVYVKNKEGNWDLDKTLKNKFFKNDEITKDYVLICPLMAFSLNDGEVLYVECTPSLCVGEDYGGHLVVSKSVSYPMMNVQLAQEALEDKLKEEGIKDKKEIDTLTKVFYNTDAYKFYNINELNEPYEFTFDIESIGIHSVNSIFGNATEILITNLEKLKEKISKDAVNFMLSNETEFEAYDLKLENVNHIFGYMLQSYLYTYFKGDDISTHDKDSNEIDSNDYKLSYIGYDQGHPLEKITTVRYSLHKSINKNVNKTAILKEMTIKTLDNIILITQSLNKQWNKMTKNKK
jgi:DNA-directed RNA polymerase alpha subunit